MFDAAIEAQRLVDWIKTNYETMQKEYQFKKIVIPISGGVESAVTAALCIKAVGREKIILLNIPYGADPESPYADSVQAHLRANYIQMNCRKMVDDIIQSLKQKEAIGNTKTKVLDLFIRKVRSSIVTMVAAHHNAFVCDSTSLSKFYLEGVSHSVSPLDMSISPIVNYTHHEIIKIGMEIGMPEFLLLKRSSDFEVRQGISFALLDNHLRDIPCGINGENRMKLADRSIKDGFNILAYMPCGLDYDPVEE